MGVKMFYNIRFYFRTWNYWRKRNAGSKFYKLLALLGIIRPPTLQFDLDIREVEIVKEFGRLASESAAANPSTEEFAKNLQEIFKGSEKK